MKLKNKGWLIWIVTSYALCLVPSGWIHWVMSVFPRGAGGGSASMGGDLAEWSAHAVLMGGAAYCLCRRFRSSAGWLRSLSAAVLLVLLIAASIEWLQGLLPASFHRGLAPRPSWNRRRWVGFNPVADHDHVGLDVLASGAMESEAADSVVDEPRLSASTPEQEMIDHDLYEKSFSKIEAIFADDPQAIADGSHIGEDIECCGRFQRAKTVDLIQSIRQQFARHSVSPIVIHKNDMSIIGVNVTVVIRVQRIGV